MENVLMMWRFYRMCLEVVLSFLVLGNQWTPLTRRLELSFVYYFFGCSELGPPRLVIWSLFSYCVLGLVNYLVCFLGYFLDHISKFSIEILLL